MFGRQQILADFGGLLTGVLADLADRVVDLGEHLTVHVVDHEVSLLVLLGLRDHRLLVQEQTFRMEEGQQVLRIHLMRVHRIHHHPLEEF